MDSSLAISQTLISLQGFGQPEFNRDRLELVAALCRESLARGAALLLLPAGILSARTEREIAECVRDIQNAANGVAVLGGVDVVGESENVMHFADGRLSFFGFALNMDDGEARTWRQTSTTSHDARRVPDDNVPGAGRIVQINGRRAAILICGELFSGPARSSIAEQRPGLVVDVPAFQHETG